MKQMRTRIMTSVLLTSILLSYYLLLPFFASALLFAVMSGWILIVEWPRVTGLHLSDDWYWLLSFIYPLLGMATIITLLLRYGTVHIFIPLYPFLAASLVDIAGYFIGSFFGKHQLMPRVSPKKTWEGLYAGVVALAWFHLGLVWWFALPVTLIQGIIITLLVAASAVGGDLFVSWHKRRQGLKDTGSLLPGHGGLLDRLDATLGVATLLGLCLLFLM